jgi:hypothetical protein
MKIEDAAEILSVPTHRIRLGVHDADFNVHGVDVRVTWDGDWEHDDIEIAQVIINGTRVNNVHDKDFWINNLDLHDLVSQSSMEDHFSGGDDHDD